MDFTDIQKGFMQKAIDLSIENVANGGGPFGAVIVLNDKVVGTGVNRVTALNDPTAHAEVSAIRAACRALGTFSLADCEIYTSCEPCPMCLSAIYWSGIRKIYYCNTKKDAADIDFDDDFIYQELAKPVAARSVDAIHMEELHEDALKAFRAWELNPTKTLY